MPISQIYKLLYRKWYAVTSSFTFVILVNYSQGDVAVVQNAIDLLSRVFETHFSKILLTHPLS